MDEEVEVRIESDKKDETPVSFIESDGDSTLVQVGGEKKGERNDDERWRRAEENQNRLANDFADIRSRLTGSGSPPQQGYTPPADPYQTELDSITAQERALGIEWEAHKAAGRLTKPLLEDFDQKSRGLAQRRTDISAHRAMANMMPRILAANQEHQFQQEYGDVRGHQQANRYARGEYDRLVARGAPESADTVRQAMNAARTEFRLAGARSQPTEQDRQQMTGFSGNNRRNMDSKSNVVKMGKSEKIMAMAMYGDAFNGDEKKAYAQWAKGPGVRAQKAMQKGRANQSR